MPKHSNGEISKVEEFEFDVNQWRRDEMEKEMKNNEKITK